MKLFDIFKRYLYLSLSLLLFVAVTSCDDEYDIPDGVILGGSGSGNSTSTIVANEFTKRIEVPALKEGNLFIQHSTLEGKDSVMTYCLEFDKSKYHSRWVAFRFDRTTRSKITSRSNTFADDPELPADCRIGFNGFGSSRVGSEILYYDRGHLCASADRLYSGEANVNTFYMSNMSPQISSFNQGYWVTFEGYVQAKGRDVDFSDTLYVVKGGTIDNDNLILDYVSRPNGCRVAVPKYYYMALLNCKNNTYSALGFWMEHKEYEYSYDGIAPTSVLAEKAVSIDYIEKMTGIDFFHNLPDVVEDAVEAEVNMSAWGLK